VTEFDCVLNRTVPHRDTRYVLTAHPVREDQMADLKFVSWKEIFLKALDESDRDKAAQLVHEADLAIYKRQRELGDSPLHRRTQHDERCGGSLAGD
jgi:hypothetical protein